MDITPRYASIQNMHCSPIVEKEEESSRPCVVWEVPRELLLHMDQLMPPLDIGFEKFEEKILENIVVSVVVCYDYLSSIRG